MNRPLTLFRPALLTAAALLAVLLAVLLAGAAPAFAQDAQPELRALPSVDVPGYMGTWYQVAWFPNRFQKQCVSDTSARYRRLDSGEIEVQNRCRLADGGIDDITGIARTDGSRLQGDTLMPAQLRVSFMPPLLRWLPIWGRYWVIDRADDGRFAVVSEPSRDYLWVLARAPSLSAADRTAIRSMLQRQGFDLSRWQDHPHTRPAQP